MGAEGCGARTQRTARPGRRPQTSLRSLVGRLAFERALVPPIPPNATLAPAPRQCGLLVLANGGWLYSNGRWLGLGARVCT